MSAQGPTLGLRPRPREVTVRPMKALARTLALGFACASIACGGRAMTNADAVTDASMRTGTPLADANGTPPSDAGALMDAIYTPSPDGGVCPAGMSLCRGCTGDLYCADTCPLPCPPGGEPLPSLCPTETSEQCLCYGSIYCGPDACAAECAPRQPDSGWCSSFYGPVSADQSDATAATPCSGECSQMLEVDASANGEIPVDYGCTAPTVPAECDAASPSACRPSCCSTD